MNIAELNLSKVKKQLAASVKARMHLEKSYETQLQSLMQFISRLSKICKNIDSALDNKLASLRDKFKKNPDITQVIPLLNDISGLINQVESRNIAQTRSTQTDIQLAAKTLKKQTNLAPPIRKKLNLLLSDLEEPHYAIMQLMPSTLALIKLYQQNDSLVNQTVKPSSDGLEQAKLETPFTTVQQDQQQNTDQQQNSSKHSQILTNLISQLAFDGKSAQQINDIQQSLIDNHDTQALLETSLDVLKLTIENISQERAAAQHFLIAINDTLLRVHQAVTGSLTKSKKASDEITKLDQTIVMEIKELSEEANKTTSLSELKSLVTDKLSAVTDVISNKVILEKQEKNALLDNLNIMENRLLDIEKEADEYKRYVAIQKLKSLQDVLTKLPNRAAFEERMEVEYQRWKRYNQSLCLAVIDIDFFKRINDTYGHIAGDKTLKVVANALKKSLRSTDFIARFGGEEFVMLFPQTSLKEITAPLNKIRHTIKNIPFKFKNEEVVITISIGVTDFKKDDKPLQVFDRADQALYEAKNTGRDKVVLHTSTNH